VIRFIFIISDPDRILAAQAAGVDSVMVDLEILGKQARQGHLDTVISRHSWDDVRRARGLLQTTRLMVRINPVHPGTVDEVENCILAGADTVMLPMFTTPDEVTTFLGALRGRARACLLLETAAALSRLDEIISVPGIDEMFVGLNDLHLSLRLDFMFEPLANGMVEGVGRACRVAGIPFGFGGIARIGQGAVPAELVLSEHARLESSQVILSRDFHSAFAGRSREEGSATFAHEVDSLRRQYASIANASPAEFESNACRFRQGVAAVAVERRRLRGIAAH